MGGGLRQGGDEVVQWWGDAGVVAFGSGAAGIWLMSCAVVF
ncbi:hypothetical protein A2U01_0077999 [Trifolium medium]|uniref:Uncharacterized protein n=1 Tax=Trifolium medium TaxID=97028 RepID=A0A392T6R0_9FABA|nr:hypothetical protein [Trifolium medium]